jgi:hypothetical protein
MPIDSPAFLNLSFNGDTKVFVGVRQYLTGMTDSYIVDGEYYAFSQLAENFTFLDNA